MKAKAHNAVPGTCSRDELEKNFNEILLKALDEALSALGTSIKDALFFHLETAFGIKKETICHDPKRLSDGLEKIFGLGAKFLENLILDYVCNKTGYKISSNPKEFSFEESVLMIKEHYIQTRAGTIR
ncbi:MAG: hypothetical protein QXW82_06050 [Candidatus Bathyarchaeia archaeon]